jgi:hypothetical protein
MGDRPREGAVLFDQPYPWPGETLGSFAPRYMAWLHETTLRRVLRDNDLLAPKD